MLFAHGFGCDQSMWRHVAPEFADQYRVVTFDLVGAGGSDRGAWDPDKYASLDGYAADVVELVQALDLHDVVFVGHSVSAMIGALAHVAAPDRFAHLVMVGPSPRYLNADDGYIGGSSPRTSRSCWSPWPACTWVVQRDGAGDHGQPGSTAAGAGTG